MDKNNDHTQEQADKCASCAHGCTGAANGSGGCSRREPRGKLYATDWLADIADTQADDVVEVMFKNTRVGFYNNPDRIPLAIGDLVVVEAQPGHDVGTVEMIGPLVDIQMRKAGIKPETQLKRVYRKARQTDIEKFEEARAREHDTMIKSRRIAEELKLDMKIGDVEFQGDGGKAIFYYIADERVDFRKLIRILADTFKIRIEMKQIGARQEAGRIGGIGPCGRPLCCSTWMSHFVSVGTGAARLQDLSMNPQKLAGQCAKLKCCLNFEVDAYAESHKKMPPKDAVLETKDALYYYFKPDILSRTVTYSTERNVPANLVTIDARRAFEIIALNKSGIKVDSLAIEADDSKPQPGFIEIVGQDSLTRFDKTKNRKKKTRQAATRQPEGEQPPKNVQNQKQRQQPQQRQRQPKPQGDAQQQVSNMQPPRKQRQQQRRGPQKPSSDENQ
ncbi:MAG: hypothetical protein K2H47_06090 [Muribaculaceae bacterium]|nr:hypothetical protein [Muribaculaceae bacterium]